MSREPGRTSQSHLDLMGTEKSGTAGLLAPQLLPMSQTMRCTKLALDTEVGGADGAL